MDTKSSATSPPASIFPNLPCTPFSNGWKPPAVSKCVEISESTLYPLLKRLESLGCVTGYTQEHNGRLRKYYAITDEGRRRITAFLEEWDELRSVYAFIQNGGVAPQPLPGAGLPQTPAPSKSTGKDLESS